MGLLDLVFPKRCVLCRRFGDYICTNCFAGISFDVPLICLVCNKPAMAGMTHPKCRGENTIDGALASIVYRGVVKKLIYQFKYKPHLTDLQSVMTELFYEGIIQQEQLHKLFVSETILIPIPLYRDKLRQRGYNHAEILSKNLGKRLGLQTKNVLSRTKKTQTQANLKREERRQNMKNAFELTNSQFSILHSQLILVDDIITSGATMLEAAKVLKKAGAKKVWGISLAHGE